MASKGSDVKMAVFIDTNMGTRIAMSVPPHITAGDFKKELETEHFNCFQRLGEIQVYGLMVKRKSCFYHLPRSLPIKHAFEGLEGTWFLHAEVSPLSTSDGMDFHERVAAKVGDHIPFGSNATDSSATKNYIESTDKKNKKRNGKRRRIKRSHCIKTGQGLHVPVDSSKKKKKRARKRLHKNFIEYTGSGIGKACIAGNDGDEEGSGDTTKERFVLFASENEVEPRKEYSSIPLVETPTEMSSQVMSVTGIIKTYFTNSNEADQLGSPSSSDVTSRVIKNQQGAQFKARTGDNCSNVQVAPMPDFMAKAPPRPLSLLLPKDSSSRTSRRKLRRTEVGKCLLIASNNLGISASKQRPEISICRFKDGKRFGSNKLSIGRSIVFEISDNDD